MKKGKAQQDLNPQPLDRSAADITTVLQLLCCNLCPRYKMQMKNTGKRKMRALGSYATLAQGPKK